MDLLTYLANYSYNTASNNNYLSHVADFTFNLYIASDVKKSFELRSPMNGVLIYYSNVTALNH